MLSTCPTASAVCLCTGSLIHPRVLLTAGHATAFIEARWAQGLGGPQDLRVSFGVNALDPTTWHEIETVITHPDYHPANVQDTGNTARYNDVGVIILKKPVNTRKIPLARLPTGLSTTSRRACSTNRTRAERSSRPQATAQPRPAPESIPGDGLRRFAQTECLGLTQSWLFTLMNPATGNGGTGYGDSGGPNFWVAPDGMLILVAITSRGDPNLVATNIAWRADIPETLEFIDFVLAMME
jgi:hypothetical protein